MKKPTFKLWEVLLISFVGSLIMSLATGYVVSVNNSENNSYVKVDDEELNTFIHAYKSILSNYYEDVNKVELIDAAINGMMTYLDDPYTTYLNEYSKEYLLDSLKGTYEGVGIEIRQDDKDIVVINVFDKSPAFIAGIKPGDILLSINDKLLIDKTSQDAVNIIRETADGTVKIDVMRATETLSFNIKRDTLFVPVIASNIFENNGKKVAYIYLAKFSATASAQFKEELVKLEKEGFDSLIVDVRNNTGGYLNGATDIASIFLKEHEVIYSLKNKLVNIKYKDKTVEFKNYKLVVLINKNSASASEVLAGALKHSYGATLIGEKSFGKGKVQQTSNLKDGSMIKYTTAEWLMPNGEGIDEVGIKPDLEVLLNEELIDLNQPINDTQLQSAIFELTK